MRETGIDLGGRVPQRLDRARAERADVVVTMGCGDECPYIPGTRYVEWNLSDPKDLSVEEVRAVRDEIAVRVRALLAELEETTPATLSDSRSVRPSPLQVER